ncbi:hypothetical protein SK128_027884 [Halocaridina rubra]|uniref:Uncharacterized protein n=1 Tax=Halocaridina rubra TaxID=373956 RepID=A0AAN8WRD8_HALRR
MVILLKKLPLHAPPPPFLPPRPPSPIPTPRPVLRSPARAVPLRIAPRSARPSNAHLSSRTPLAKTGIPSSAEGTALPETRKPASAEGIAFAQGRGHLPCDHR